MELDNLNVTKIEFIVIGSRQKLQTRKDSTIDIHIEGKEIEQRKSLGLYIDDNLTFKKHINEIAKNISSGIGALKRVRPFICNTAENIYI